MRCSLTGFVFTILVSNVSFHLVIFVIQLNPTGYKEVSRGMVECFLYNVGTPVCYTGFFARISLYIASVLNCGNLSLFFNQTQP